MREYVDVDKVVEYIDRVRKMLRVHEIPEGTDPRKDYDDYFDIMLGEISSMPTSGMTLSEFYDQFCSQYDKPTLYVFESEDDANGWLNYDCTLDDAPGFEISLVVKSDLKMDVTIKKEWCDAIVRIFYAVQCDVMCVVVERKHE